MASFLVEGGSQEEDLKFKASEINHLRLLLAWMRCEYMLDENMQAGFAQGAIESMQYGTSEERVREILVERAEKINHVPKYVRQAVKILTKMIREHEKKLNIIDVEAEKKDASILAIK